MDPLTIIVSAASLLEVGMKISKEVDGIIKLWTTASPVIYALHNEISDLNVVLDYMSHAWNAVNIKANGAKFDNHFLKAFNAQLEQAEDLLGQLDRLVTELRAASSFKMKLKWMKKNSRAAELQGKLRDVRSRLSELLAAYNV
jgi:hypothetical protein